jgi:hypothetical protein
MKPRPARLSAFLVVVLAAAGAASTACLALSETPDVWACDTSADCEAAEHCVAGKCAPHFACVDDTDCAGGLICDAGICLQGRRPECTPGDSTCAPYRCGAGSTCLRSCIGSQDCLTGNACESGTCVEMGECHATTAQYVCDGYACVGGECLTECEGEVDCIAGYGCVEGECLQLLTFGARCELDAECAASVCCANGASERRCLVSCAALGPGDICQYDGECISGSCSQYFCAACTTAACVDAVCADVECGTYQGASCGDCEGKSYCSGNRCVPACVSAECGVDNGVDCGSCDDGEVCSVGTCVEQVCSPDDPYFCDGDALMRCDDGLSSYGIGFCDGNEYCRDGNSTCSTYACQPNRGFCDGTVFVPCNVAGRPVLSEEHDCALDGAPCSSEGCLELTVDEVDTPAARPVEGQTTCGNVYRVDDDVRLYGLAQKMPPSAPSEVWWFIYRGADPLGPFDLVMPVITGSTQYVDDGYASPELDVLLTAGSYYFMGAAFNGVAFMLDEDATTPQNLSFGALTSGRCSPQALQSPVTELLELGVAPQTVVTRAR